MDRLIIQTRKFSITLDDLTAKKKLSVSDYEAFEKWLLANLEEGDLIQGTGGMRKTRIKAASKGKSSGFRVCYFDNPKSQELYLILIYSKNEKSDLTEEEKKILKKFISAIKGL